MSILDEKEFKPAASLDAALEVIDETEEEEPHRPISGILSYGADYTVDSLVKRVRERSFDIPRFQRQDIWTDLQKSRFIESLLLDLPVPGIFVAKDPGNFVELGEDERSKHIVVDGHQRLLALQKFCDTELDKKDRISLRGVQEPWNDKFFEELTIDDQRRIEDSIIHTTIIKQENPEDTDAILEVFNRLNTGGNLLSPQEIRVAFFSNSVIPRLLEEINDNEDWRHIYGKPNKRMKDQEFILRFWALYVDYEGYKDCNDSMRVFLDSFYKKASAFPPEKHREFINIFFDSMRTIRSELDRKAFRPKRSINAAIFDSVMVGIAKRLDSGEIKSRGEIKTVYENLLRDENYRDACQEGTSKIVKVETRISAATKAFRDVS